MRFRKSDLDNAVPTLRDRHCHVHFSARNHVRLGKDDHNGHNGKVTVLTKRQ